MKTLRSLEEQQLVVMSSLSPTKHRHLDQHFIVPTKGTAGDLTANVNDIREFSVRMLAIARAVTVAASATALS